MKKLFAHGSLCGEEETDSLTWFELILKIWNEKKVGTPLLHALAQMDASTNSSYDHLNFEEE